MGYTVQNLGQWQDWTPTITGFSSATPPYVHARYVLIGKTCVIHFYQLGQTSNATTFTMTLPFASASASNHCTGTATDNTAGVTTPIRVDTAAGSNIATLTKAPAATAWTATGAKAAKFTLIYEIQ